jgi:selenocysteine-specific elongation factor
VDVDRTKITIDGMPTDLILGTAGHIDHGKTSLIKALTGVDTDRLPEEKRRGITIDLGFAHLDLGEYRLGIVDVPGHERFVRNMLAGATGMDLALLVVAADDSIKPQTLEHLEILRLLELPAGVIAITKCDLAEAEWMELVGDEIRSLVEGTFLADSPIVLTSAATGQGLDELRQKLSAAAALAAARRAQRLQAPFRMAVDRVFTVAGHGTVVTGSVSAGQAAVGDELMIEPGEFRVRVRGLQNHDQSVDQVHRGQRAAINLAGVHHDQVGRGHELAAPGHLRPTRMITAHLHLSQSATKPLKDRTVVRLHLGAAELLARIRLRGQDQLAQGGQAVAQCFLERPAVAVWRQPLVIRRQSPMITIGGGVVLDPDAVPVRKPDDQDLAQWQELLSTDPLRRAQAAAYFAGLRLWEPGDLVRLAGIDQPAAVYRQLVEQGDILEIPVSPTRIRRLHRRVFDRLCQRVERLLARWHDRHPLRTSLEKAKLIGTFRDVPDEAVLQAVLAAMQKQGQLKLTRDTVGLASRGPNLSQSEDKLLRQIVQWYLDAGIESPTVDQVRSQAARNQNSVPQLIKIAADDGQLVRITDDYYVHVEVDRRLRTLLTEKLQASSGMTMSEIRDVLQTTRKFAVPYCEYLDRIGFTRRDGDVRVLGTS